MRCVTSLNALSLILFLRVCTQVERVMTDNARNMIAAFSHKAASIDTYKASDDLEDLEEGSRGINDNELDGSELSLLPISQYHP